mmetsp:Transcript_18635/g.22829  ORF Transcript_18635/g.22829 Transcript_18635/m.22829 type:complete len:216 (+) Transcript_18635:196-843(+)
MIGRKPKASQNLSECRSSDLFALAQKAHEIHYVLGKDDFMHQMVYTLGLDTDARTTKNSAFSSLVDNQNFVKESVVVSSWTIKTSVGGGSVYDHKLDPFPGTISYVHVSPAYIGVSPLSTLTVIVLVAMTFQVFRKRKKESKKDHNSFMLMDATFCPKPFEIVKKKLGVTLMRNKKNSRNSLAEANENESNKDDEHYSVVKNTKRRSRLSDIISN